MLVQEGSQANGVSAALSRLEGKRMDLETTRPGQRLDFGIRRADESQVEPRSSQPEAQVQSGCHRAGAATLVQHLHD
jgi:hypothetical protein